MIPAIILSFGMIFFPESPRWLFDHGRYDHWNKHINTISYISCREAEALQVLADLHGGGNKNDELVVLEYEEIKQQVCNSHLVIPSPFS